MKLGDYLEKEFILPQLQAKTKTEVLAELVELLRGKIDGLEVEDANQVLLERENLGSTGIGEGVAIPHGKMENLEKIILVAGRSTEGVDFEALDFKPCHIFFLVLAPEQVAGMHLRVLAHISRLLKNKDFRKEFMQAPDRDALWDLLKDS